MASSQFGTLHLSGLCCGTTTDDFLNGDHDEVYVLVAMSVVNSKGVVVRTANERKPASNLEQGVQDGGSGPFFWSLTKPECVSLNQDGLICFLADEKLNPGETMAVSVAFMEQDGGINQNAKLKLQQTADAAAGALGLPSFGGILADFVATITNFVDADDYLGSMVFTMTKDPNGVFLRPIVALGKGTSGGHEEGVPDAKSNLENWRFKLEGTPGSQYFVRVRARAHD